jgi:ribosomal protein S18 acetylase RimI-like enzyme
MMLDEVPAAPLVIRFATPGDIAHIEELDNFSTSPTRNIHRDVEKYFGSIDPSTHEHTLIFLAEVDGVIAAKAELMLPPTDMGTNTGPIYRVGYIKRVVVHPEYRKRGISRTLMQHIITYAREELALAALDLHVWENNHTAINLYRSLGFELQHRELYFRLPLD